MISSLIPGLFKIKIQLSVSEQEKKHQRIYDLLYAKTKANELKKYEIIGVPLWPPSSPDLNCLDYTL